MDNGPGQREEHHVGSFQGKVVILPLRDSFLVFEARKNHHRLQVDELVSAAIDNAELKRCYAPVGRNDGLLAVDDVRCRTGKSSVHQAGGQGKTQQSNNRLQGHNQVGCHAHRSHISVSNSGERMDAEKKCLPETVLHRRTLKGVGTTEKVAHGKDHIQDQIDGRHDRDKHRGRHAQEAVVGKQRAQGALALAINIKSAIAIQQP